MYAPTLSEVLTHGYGVERSFLCPVHGDTNPSASVNTIKNVWVCYTCGAHGKLDGEDLLGEIDYEAVRRHVRKQATNTEPLPESWLRIYEGDHEYWRSRGFSPETIAYYRLGYDYEHDCAVYPLRGTNGDVLGVVRRFPRGPNKYKYPYGVDVSSLLFDYHRLDSAVLVLTEGATDAVAAHEVGVQASAVYGSRFSRAQAALVRRLDPKGILCAFDQDRAGYSAYQEVLYRLPEYPVARAVWSPGDGKDLNELTEKIRQETLLKGLDLFG